MDRNYPAKRHLTYEEAEREYESRIKYQSGKYEGVGLENNTRLVKRGEDYAVKLHSTDVVTIHPDGTYTLRTGGWKTRTTKDRINKYAPVRIHQEDYVWYVSGLKWSEAAEQRGQYPRYRSGPVKVDSKGRVLEEA